MGAAAMMLGDPQQFVDVNPGSLVGWPPTPPNRPVLANWRVLYDRQVPDASHSISVLSSYWRDYVDATAVASISELSKVPDAPWLGWFITNQELSIVSRFSTPGNYTVVTMRATGADGTVDDRAMRLDVIDPTVFGARATLTVGFVSPVSPASLPGAAVVTITPSAPVVAWDIVSGCPHDDGSAVGFSIADGVVRVSDPRLFVDDPYVSTSYLLTIRATDAAGTYSFVDVVVGRFV